MCILISLTRAGIGKLWPMVHILPATFFFSFFFFSGPQARDDFMLLNGYILNDYTCAYIMTFMLPVGLENLKYLLFGLWGESIWTAELKINLSILFFLKNQFLFSLIFSIVLLISILLIFCPIFLISLLLLNLGFICSFQLVFKVKVTVCNLQ